MRADKNLLKCRFLHDNIKRFYTEGRYFDETARDIMVSLLIRDLELLRRNKILVSLGELLSISYSYTNELLSQRIHRYRTYYQETRRIFQKFDERGIEAVCIKSFTSIPKDIADVDILIRDESDLSIVETLLIELGYRKRKKGVEQHLWTAIKDNVIVDIELHTNVAAASYIYYPKAILFKRSERRDDIVFPSPVDSILLLTAHAIMKDFYITLADLLDFEITLEKHKVDFGRLNSEASLLGLTLPLQVFRYVSSSFNSNANEHEFKLISITKIKEFPLRPFMHTVFLSYLYQITRKLKQESLRSVLSQTLRLPTGKGIDYFLRFAFGGEPPVKGLAE